MHELDAYPAPKTVAMLRREGFELQRTVLAPTDSSLLILEFALASVCLGHLDAHLRRVQAGMQNPHAAPREAREELQEDEEAPRPSLEVLRRCPPL